MCYVIIILKLNLVPEFPFSDFSSEVKDNTIAIRLSRHRRHFEPMN